MSGEGPGASPPESAPPPRIADLVALPPDQWARLLVHARAALNDLEEAAVTRRVQRLRASPTSRLAGGRMRRELAEELAGGGPAWRGVVERVRASEDGELGWLLEGQRPPAAPRRPSAPAAPSPDPELEASLEAARDRARQLREERDAARRRVRGAEARVESLEGEVRELEEALAGERERARELEAALDRAAEERERAVDRERRRVERELSELREDLRTHRRRQQRRREEELRQQRAQEAAREAERAREPAGEGAAAGAVPGRPSRLPANVAPGTVEAARELLEPGRLVLVDGYNLTREHREHLDLEQQRTWLIRVLEGLAARRRVRPRVYFDGQGGPAGPWAAARGVQVRFSAEGTTADDEIVFAVAALPPDTPALVVTDDRELIERVEAYSVDRVGTRAFLSAAE